MGVVDNPRGLMRSVWRMATASLSYRFIDIGANLTDPMYQGIYHGKSYHPPDLDAVLQRSYESDVQKIIITSGTLSDCLQALSLSQNDDHLFCTVGVHPTRSGEFENTPGVSPDEYMDQLLQIAVENRHKIVCIGECGLDYDRLHFCDKQTQLKYFEKQLVLTEKTKLPLFLHCRNAFSDFIDILRHNKCKIQSSGVVHSFDGSLEQVKIYLEFGLYIGINGCSLKTEENLKVIKEIPSDKILLETDAPWCEIRPTHASSKFVTTHFPSKKKERWENGVSVKSRNEPRNILQVLEVLSSIKGIERHELAQQIYKNTCKLFNFENTIN